MMPYLPYYKDIREYLGKIREISDECVTKLQSNEK